MRNQESEKEFNIEPGLTCKQEYLVEEQHTAKHVGSGDVEVLSTPSMILFMENTALNCVQNLLPQGYTTVGIAVNVKHLNPAPKGEKVVVEARVEKVEGKKIVFHEIVKWRDLVIGEGIHERYIVNTEKFLNKVKKLLSQKS